MSKHVIGKVESIPPGSQLRVEVLGRPIAVFNTDGRFYALRDTCPHQGAALSKGYTFPEISASAPGCYVRNGARWFVRCPWHGWEYDIATGQSYFDPRNRVRRFEVDIEGGAELLAGPYVAETIPVSVDGEYVVLEMDDRPA